MDAVLSRVFHRGPAVRAAVSLSYVHGGLAVFVLGVWCCCAPCSGRWRSLFAGRYTGRPGGDDAAQWAG